MNKTLSINCPNCGAELYFNADKQKLHCNFCDSEYTDEDLQKLNPSSLYESKNKEKENAEFCEHMMEYECPNCGAEAVTDEHTIADICVYCHSAVMVKGRLSGQIKPDRVIPFKYGKDEAQRKLVAMAKKRWFVPKDFFSKSQLDKIRGVYYPFWITDSDTDATLSAQATRLRVWRTSKLEYTETSRFNIHRQGFIHFEDITTCAFSEADKEMLEGVLPYPSDALTEFSMPFLSGFQAKKRNIEWQKLSDEVKQRMNDYAKSLLSNTINGYHSVKVNNTRIAVQKIHWEYSLLPIWIMTYKSKKISKGSKDTYIYAMNGYTGKVYGEFPLSFKKLAAVCGAVFSSVLALVLIIGGLT